MQWNKHVWSLFLHILPYSNKIRNENAGGGGKEMYLQNRVEKEFCIF